MYRITIIIPFLISFGCAGPNPNPGERSVNMAWTSQNYDRAFEFAKPEAEKGMPWAQLRLGIFYENGWGVQRDIDEAEYWYKKALEQKASGAWADGQIAGAVGKAGYFNQNSDALIAEYNLAQLYYNNNRSLEEALMHIDNVLNESEGKPVFFCCGFSEGRYFTQEQFLELKKKIDKKCKTENANIGSGQGAQKPVVKWDHCYRAAQTSTRIGGERIYPTEIRGTAALTSEIESESYYPRAFANI